MKTKSIAMNAVLNIIKTVSAIIFPLVTFPYISRVLDVDSIGSYNFAASIISYFTLIAGLGVNNYAIREGAQYRNDRNKISRFASEVYSINIISSVVAYLLLFFVVANSAKLQNYGTILLILSAEVVFTCVGVNWIYNIFEEFWYITFVTVLFQVISMILMFVLVKTNQDLLKYVGIVVFANVGGQVLYRLKARKYVDVRAVFDKSLVKHLAPIFLLFSTSIVSMIYVSSDTTILGFLTNDYRVGLYSVSTKIYKIIKQLFLAIVVVAIPRVVLYVRKNESEKCQKLIDNTFNLLLALCVPAMVGLICTSKYIILIISGEKYLEADLSLKILGVALLFSILSSFYANCVLIPNREDKSLLTATIVSATINIIGNFLIIPFFQEVGAAITTVVAEVIMVAMCGRKSKNIMKPVLSKRNTASIFFSCSAIVLICGMVNRIIKNEMIGFSISVLGSVFAFFIVNILLKNPVIMSFLQDVLGRIKRKTVRK